MRDQLVRARARARARRVRIEVQKKSGDLRAVDSVDLAYPRPSDLGHPGTAQLDDGPNKRLVNLSRVDP